MKVCTLVPGELVRVRDFYDMKNDDALKPAIDRAGCLGIGRDSLMSLRDRGVFQIRKVDAENELHDGLGPRIWLDGSNYYFSMFMLEKADCEEELAELTDDEIALYVGA